MQFYFYKLTADDGGAPCVQDGLLSLAICKPMIRSTAGPGDVIYGFAASSLHTNNRLLYIARVTDKARNGDYYTTAKFARREDRVYQRRNGRFLWRVGALHHGPKDLTHDLGTHPEYSKANVLLSDDFRYFGANGSADYKATYPLIKNAVARLGRGHRVHHSRALFEQLHDLMLEVWKGTRQSVIGERTSKPRPGVCHRGRSCGVIEGDGKRKR